MKCKTGGWNDNTYAAKQTPVDDSASMASGVSGISAGKGGTST